MQIQAVHPKAMRVPRQWPFLVSQQVGLSEAARRVIAKTREIWAVAAK